MKKGQWLLIGSILIIISIASILSVPKMSLSSHQKMMSKPFREMMEAYMDAASSSLLVPGEKDNVLKNAISIHAELHSYFLERGMSESTFIIVIEKQDPQALARFFNGADEHASFHLVTRTSSYPPVLVAPLNMRNITISSAQELSNVTLKIYMGEEELCFTTSVPSGFSSAVIALVGDEEGNVMILRTSNLKTC